ncbi:MAG: hypothetical protein NC411_06940 [Bacteroides sp.]|nr:hypothetical protein [Bacteroides sp.]
MKRTTYLMLGAFIAGFGLVAAFVVMLLSNPVAKDQNRMIGGEQIDVALKGDFSEIIFEDTNEYGGYKIRHFRGLTIEQSDSVTKPVLLMGADWSKLVRTDVVGDTLRLSVDVDCLTSQGKKKSDKPVLMLFDSAEGWPLRLLVPRAMSIGQITCADRSLRLCDFNAERLTVKVKGRVVMSGCRIGLLDCKGTRMSELKLDNSTVDRVSMRQPKDEFKVDCCDGSGFIDAMDVRGIANGNDEFDLTKANVKTMRWTPADSTSVINLLLGRQIEILQTGD